MRAPTASAASRIGFWLAVAMLVALHIAPPRCASTRAPGSVLPWDLGFHLLWMAAAWAAIIFVTGVVWREEGDGGE